jgi:hypothetical protein
VSARQLIAGSLVAAALILVIYLLVPTLPVNGRWWTIASIFGAILLNLIYFRRGHEIDTNIAFTLGLEGYLYVSGFRLLIVSMVVLARQGSVGPFGPEELGLIALSGFVLILISYKGASETFRKAAEV